MIEPQGEIELVDGAWVETPGDGEEDGGVVALRGPPVPDQGDDRLRGHARRRVTMRGSRRRHPSRLLRPRGGSPTWTPTRRGLAVLPQLPAVLRSAVRRAQDRELAKLCVEAYNDWMVDEWCAGSDGRLLPLSSSPIWDVELAAAEIRRHAAVCAVAFSRAPRVARAALDPRRLLGPVLARRARDGHGGLHAHQVEGRTGEAVRRRPDPGHGGADLGELGRVDDRLPVLRGAGPSPEPEADVRGEPDRLDHYLERADDSYHTTGGTQGEERLPEPPSYYRRQIYSCFFKDSAGMKLLDDVGIDNVLFETDYPHSDGTFPHSRETAQRLFGHLAPDDVYKLARGNAIRLFDLPFP
ncbi:MAG: amidohydrolase family protein [Acidimicrobiales bacterium]